MQGVGLNADDEWDMNGHQTSLLMQGLSEASLIQWLHSPMQIIHARLTKYEYNSQHKYLLASSKAVLKCVYKQ